MKNITLTEIKRFLGLDGMEQDTLLVVFLNTAIQVCEKVLRYPIEEEEAPEIIRTAILYIVWQLYFHRDDFKISEVENTVAIMLSDLRDTRF